jgi:hypothetical protein
MKWRAFGRMPQWVRLSDLLGRTGGSVQSQPALDEQTGLARAQDDAGTGNSAGRSGMRPTLPDEVRWCNKGRTQELTARRSTPARSADHQLAWRLESCNRPSTERAGAKHCLAPR